MLSDSLRIGGPGSRSIERGRPNMRRYSVEAEPCPEFTAAWRDSPLRLDAPHPGCRMERRGERRRPGCQITGVIRSLRRSIGRRGRCDQ